MKIKWYIFSTTITITILLAVVFAVVRFYPWKAEPVKPVVCQPSETIPLTINTSPIKENAFKIDSVIESYQKLESIYLDTGFYKKDGIIPIAYSGQTVIGFKLIKNIEKEGVILLTGIPEQDIEIYLVRLNTGTKKKLGSTGIIISSCWNESKSLLALVSSDHISVIDIGKESMTNVSSEFFKKGLYSASWQPDDYSLDVGLDTLPNCFIYDYKLKKIAQNRGGFKEGDIVLRGKFNGRSLISKGNRVGTADGLYIGENELFGAMYNVVVNDTMGDYLLLTKEDLNLDTVGQGISFCKYNAVSGENIELEKYQNQNSAYKIYKASFLKTTGDVIYTTLELKEDHVEFLFNRIDRSGKKESHVVPSPIYNVSPGESMLFFSEYDGKKILALPLPALSIPEQTDESNPSSDITAIKELMNKALNIYSSDTPNIDNIKKIFINTYDPVPQEALENILTEAKDHQHWEFNKVTPGKNIDLTYKLYDSGTRAHVSLGELYFRCPHELVKLDGKWYITGFSTWPNSTERKEVLNASNIIIKNILNSTLRKQLEARSDLNDWVKNQLEIIDRIANEDIQAGEVELWQMSEPHRAMNLNYINDARVKIVVKPKSGGAQEKYVLNMTKHSGTGSWGFGSLSHIDPLEK